MKARFSPSIKTAQAMGLTVKAYMCRLCKQQGGTLVRLDPARGYACTRCIQKHGKDNLVEAAMRADWEKYDEWKQSQRTQAAQSPIVRP